jgi:hypothetical protein
MGRLLKYELKGSYKVIGIILVILIIVALGLNFKIGEWAETTIMGITSFAVFGALLSAFIYLVELFRKELYEDTGYLTFTLPITGNSIVGAKLLSSLIWIFVVGTIGGLLGLLNAKRAFGPYVRFGSIFTNQSFIMAVISGVASVVTVLLLIYFSITISRMTIRNKKVGGLWFIIFILLNVVIAYFRIKLIEWMPYYIDTNSWRIVKQGMNMVTDININGAMLQLSINGNVYLNIANIIFSIVLMVGLFLGTGYLLEKKIDL